MDFKEVVNSKQMVMQQRYALYMKKYNEFKHKEDLGHALECSWVLIELFGLTSSEVEQLEKNDYAGLLDKDLE